jgi:hypothetical protein
MATPQGVFEMKYFFTPGYQTATGESMSNTSGQGGHPRSGEKRRLQCAAK